MRFLNKEARWKQQKSLRALLDLSGQFDVKLSVHQAALKEHMESQRGGQRDPSEISEFPDPVSIMNQIQARYH